MKACIDSVISQYVTFSVMDLKPNQTPEEPGDDWCRHHALVVNWCFKW